MKEKINEKKEALKTWWTENKDKVVKLGLAGAGLYMLGHIHATNKIMNHDRVYVSSDTQDDDIEIVDF